MNFVKCLSTAFYIVDLPFIMFSEILCDDRITLDVFGYKVDIFHIFCVITLSSFVTSVGIGRPLLFCIYLAFIPKFY